MQRPNSERREVFEDIIRLILVDKHLGSEKFYNQYAKMIFSIAKQVCKTDDKANSALNSVLVKVWRNADKLLEIKNPEGWIYRVTQNCAKDELKGKWHLELKENIVKCEDEISKLLDDMSFNEIISPLNEKERKIFTLRFVKGYTYQEIAEICNKPLATITSCIYRGTTKIEKNYKI